MDIQTLRNMRNNNVSKLVSSLEQETTKKSYEDARFWKPERDKAGNATAQIRFLGGHEKDDLPWVKIFNHGFKGPTGRWYIENSRTTLGEADPVSELNNKLWNSTTDDLSPERKQARDQKRRLSYISNILVIKDPKHPENEGKVFLFKYGKKIFDKIMEAARPTFEDDDPINVFDYWNGCDFRLRVKMVERFPNYDSSEFLRPTPLAESDEGILDIVNQQYRLGEFLEESNFKPYNELKQKLEQVLNMDGVEMSRAADEFEETLPQPEPVSKPAPQAKSVSGDTEEDDVMSYFQKLADE